MKSVTQNEVKKNILDILNMVQTGEDFLIQDDHNKKNMAVIISYQKYKKKNYRPLGILKGKAKYKLKDDFKRQSDERI